MDDASLVQCLRLDISEMRLPIATVFMAFQSSILAVFNCEVDFVSKVLNKIVMFFSSLFLFYTANASKLRNISLIKENIKKFFSKQ